MKKLGGLQSGSQVRAHAPGNFPERLRTVGIAASRHDGGNSAAVVRAQGIRADEPSRTSRLIVFIDDLDGLRKVPENVPNREDVQQYLGIPVSKIPDPFGCCASSPIT